jgi:hypothetical protein
LLNSIQQQVEVLHAICLCTRIEAECNRLPSTLKGKFVPCSGVHSATPECWCCNTPISLHTRDYSYIVCIRAETGPTGFDRCQFPCCSRGCVGLRGVRGILFSLGIPAPKKNSSKVRNEQATTNRGRRHGSQSA